MKKVRRKGEPNWLNALQVDREKRPGMHADGAGLYLLVSKSGAKSWIFRYRQAGRLRDMGLGSLNAIGLAAARIRARECREQRLDGLDPLEVRKAERQREHLEAVKTKTFKECAGEYIAAHKTGWKNPKHAAQWPSTLETYVYPVFGFLPVQAIDTGLVMKAIEPIWTTKPETASRVRGRIEAILDGAAARGYRQGENPARWRGHLDKLLPQKTKVRRVEHHPAMPWRDLPAFMAELRCREGIAARALEFTILTAVRTGEAIGTTWSEIDEEARLWVIPPERMKMEREHRVPLSESVMTILGKIDPNGAKLFSISNMAMAMLLRRMGHGDLTVHGFRSSFSDWCAETGKPVDLREVCLAHANGDKVAAAYQRGDLLARRRELMEEWAQFAAGE
jgi:integrase